jgi:hypothetical protein
MCWNTFHAIVPPWGSVLGYPATDIPTATRTTAGRKHARTWMPYASGPKTGIEAIGIRQGKPRASAGVSVAFTKTAGGVTASSSAREKLRLQIKSGDAAKAQVIQQQSASPFAPRCCQMFRSRPWPMLDVVKSVGLNCVLCHLTIPSLPKQVRRSSSRCWLF